MVWRNDQVTESETAKILEIARQSLTIQGDWVEFGCYRGDTSLLLAEILRGTEKKLWLYDSFEGLPEKTESDRSVAGENFQKGELAVSKRGVKLRFLRSGLAVPKITKGWFSELTEKDLPEKISLAFLDGDLYESIRESLWLVGPKMSAGGYILVHDYTNEALPGVAKAVGEWLKQHNYQLVRYESLAIIGVDEI